MFTSTQPRRCCDRRSVPQFVGLFVTGLLLALSAGCSSFAARAQNAEGVRLFEQARYQEALQQFQEATYADWSNPDGHYNLAATYHRLGLVEGGQSDIDRAEN